MTFDKIIGEILERLDVVNRKEIRLNKKESTEKDPDKKVIIHYEKIETVREKENLQVLFEAYMNKSNKGLKEKEMYCFKATLKKIGKDDFFEVPYKVLAKDKLQARDMLSKWLENPKQTGYKYEYCDGLTDIASDFIIVAE